MTEQDRGFYFAVFQSDSTRDIVKAWIDGSEDYTIFSRKDFLELAFDIEATMCRALREYSYFLWDVQRKQINRLRFQQTPEALRKLINEKVVKDEPAQDRSISEQYFHGESKIDVDKVSIELKQSL